MALLCSMLGHVPNTTLHHGAHAFAVCHHCGCNLVRSGEDEWEPLQGLVVVPSLGAAADIRPSTSSRQASGRPLRGTAALFGALARISRLGEHGGEQPPGNSGRVQVISLPHAGAKRS